jgi:dihydropyrimidinase
VSAGRRGPRAFADTRPAAVEDEAVLTTLAAAARTGAKCHLVHLSSSSGVEEIRWPTVGGGQCRGRGLSAPSRARRHRYDAPDAARYLVAPPLRPREHVEALWQALASGTILVVGSDPCHRRTPVPAEIAARSGDCCYGIAGVGARLPVLLSEGLARGLSIERLVSLAATEPARAFRMARKDRVEPGYDADIVIWEPGVETVIGDATFDDGTGDTVYRGRRVRGRMRDVFARGRPLVRDGTLVNGHAGGRFVAPSGDIAPLRGR